MTTTKTLRSVCLWRDPNPVGEHRTKQRHKFVPFSAGFSLWSVTWLELTQYEMRYATTGPNVFVRLIRREGLAMLGFFWHGTNYNVICQKKEYSSIVSVIPKHGLFGVGPVRTPFRMTTTKDLKTCFCVTRFQSMYFTFLHFPALFQVLFIPGLNAVWKKWQNQVEQSPTIKEINLIIRMLWGGAAIICLHFLALCSKWWRE